MTLKPAAYRWRWSKGQSFQLAHKPPQPIQKMGRLRPQPDVEPLYDQRVYEILMEVRKALSLAADSNEVAKDIFQYIEDELA